MIDDRDIRYQFGIVRPRATGVPLEQIFEEIKTRSAAKSSYLTITITIMITVPLTCLPSMSMRLISLTAHRYREKKTAPQEKPPGPRLHHPQPRQATRGLSAWDCTPLRKIRGYVLKSRNSAQVTMHSYHSFMFAVAGRCFYHQSHGAPATAESCAGPGDPGTTPKGHGVRHDA